MSLNQCHFQNLVGVWPQNVYVTMWIGSRINCIAEKYGKIRSTVILWLCSFYAEFLFSKKEAFIRALVK